ncbi:MAG: hypothetical protein WCK42_08100, partial [Myxococcaceae bacterium]
VGSLVFDTLNNRFARGKESSAIQVLLAYVSGGEGLLKGSVIQITQAPKPSVANTKKKPEPKKPVPKKPVAKKPVPKKKPAPKKTAAAPKKKAPVKKIIAKKPVPKKKPVAKKPIAKKPAPKKAVPKKKMPVKKTSIKKPADPNAFIKQNYKKMSNKELAVITGLSEHTIRRKLGEWGLKRPIK